MLRRLRERLLAAAQGREIAMDRASVHGLGGRAVIEAELAEAEPGTPRHAALVRALCEFSGLEPLMVQTTCEVRSTARTAEGADRR